MANFYNHGTRINQDELDFCRIVDDKKKEKKYIRYINNELCTFKNQILTVIIL